MFRKDKSAVEGDRNESWSGIEMKGELNKRRCGWRLVLWGFTEKKHTLYLIQLRGKPQYLDQRSGGNKATRVTCTAEGTDGGEPDGQVVSIKRAADRRTQRNRKIINEKRKVQGQERIHAEHLDGLKTSDNCDFEKPRKRAYQKRKIESNEQS